MTLAALLVFCAAAFAGVAGHPIRIGIADGRGKIVAIHHLEMEDYLLGVLPSEMDPSWPLEALKAQAVIARTFAYAHLGRYGNEGFDLTSDTRSQNYKKRDSVPEPANRAVQETKGEVLGFRGQVLKVYYHSSCGGHTARPSSVWGYEAKLPRALRGVPDHYCQASPYRQWTAYFPDQDILAALSRGRETLAGPLLKISVSRRDPSGIAAALRVVAGADSLEINADQFRRRLGAGLLKSARILAIRRLEGGVEFTGAGSGHGVGLCQWGARLQAERGKDYEEILKFYFPGSVLSLVE